MKTFEVEIGFCGFIGCSETYTVDAVSQSAAEADALEEAAEDLSVENVEQLDDDEYEVEIGFGGFVGCSETYTVDADSSEDAEIEALSQAQDDLTIESVEEQED